MAIDRKTPAYEINFVSPEFVRLANQARKLKAEQLLIWEQTAEEGSPVAKIQEGDRKSVV